MSDTTMTDAENENENEYDFENKFPLASDTKERLFLYHFFRAFEQLAIDGYGVLQPLADYVDALDDDDNVDEEEFSRLALDPLTRMDKLWKRIQVYLRVKDWARAEYEKGLPADE